MFDLPPITHGEMWLERKEILFDKFALDMETTKEPALPKRLQPKDKVRYYKLKLCAVFASLGYRENIDESFDSIAVYKMYRKDMEDKLIADVKAKRQEYYHKSYLKRKKSV